MGKLVTLLITLALALPLSAAQYYVRTDGNNGNAGTADNAGGAWLTVQHAADTVAAGDTVNVRAGTFAEDVTYAKTGPIAFSVAGSVRTLHTTGTRLTWTGGALGPKSGANPVWLEGISNTVSGVSVTGSSGVSAVRFTGASNTATNCTITGTTMESAVTFNSDSTDSTMVNSKVHNLDNADAFRFWGERNRIAGCTVTNLLSSRYDLYHVDFVQFFALGPTTVARNNLIENNFVKDIVGQVGHWNSANDGVPVSPNMSGIIFRNNICINTQQSLYVLVPNCQVYNNLFYNCANGSSQDAMIHVYQYPAGSGYGAGTGSTVYNNAFVGCGTGDTVSRGYTYFSTGVADYNLAITLSGGLKNVMIKEPHSLTSVNPLYVDAAALNFHLQAATPLLHKGAYIAGNILDRDGVARDNDPEIGPYGSTAGTDPDPPVDPPEVPLLTSPFQLEDSLFTAPWIKVGSYLSNSVQTVDPVTAGLAKFRFNVVTNGHYWVPGNMNAPSSGANSFFLQVDSMPTTPLTISDVATTSGWETRYVNWRGDGSDGAPQYATNQWYLEVGEHVMFVCGREAGFSLDYLELAPVTVVQPATPVIEWSNPDYSGAEASGTITLTASRTGDLSGASVVSAVTSDGTAVAPTHYTAQNTSLSFGAGTNSVTLAIAVVDDAVPNMDRFLYVTLGNPPTGATLGTYTIARVTILNDDSRSGKTRIKRSP